MTDERTAFRDFKSRPTSDNLIGLLRAHQERVYRLCLQVLHRAHDAEDAAQEVLIRIVDGVRKIDDAEAFRRWAYRVSLNAALEAARKASRRRTHESRAAMEDPPGKPLDEESRGALFEAIAKLADEPRSLILDHYFEGETLESLGSREGISAQAVSKRLERAREDLKRALPATLLGIPDLGRLFEGGVTSSVAPDLISGPVLAKVHSVAAALAAGGAVVASKISILAAVLITAIFCLTAGTGLGVLLKSRAVPNDRAKVVELESRLAEALRRSSVPVPAAVRPDRAPAPPSVPVELTPREAAASKLKAKLGRYKAWMEEYYREYDEVCKKHREDVGAINAYRARKLAELGEMLVGMKELACAAPQEFLEFLREPGNERYLRSLVLRGLGFYQSETSRIAQQFIFFPRELSDGMLDVLKSGSSQQKLAVLQYFQLLWGQPEEYRACYLEVLNDSDVDVQREVVQAIWQTNSWTPESLAAVTHLGQTTSNSDLRMTIANGMSNVTLPEATAYLVDRLETTLDVQETISVGQTLDIKLLSIYREGRSVGEMEDRAVKAAVAALHRGLDPGTFLVVVRVLLPLPAAKSRPALVQALGLAPTEKVKQKLAELIKLIDGGETSRDDLRKASWE